MGRVVDRIEVVLDLDVDRPLVLEVFVVELEGAESGVAHVIERGLDDVLFDLMI